MSSSLLVYAHIGDAYMYVDVQIADMHVSVLHANR